MTGCLDRVAAIVGHPAFSDLGVQEFRVLLALFVHADRDGLARPSLTRVARIACCDYRDTRRVVGKLVERGLVEVLEEARGRRARRYRIVPSAMNGDIVQLLRGGELPPATEGGDSPPAESVEGGADRRRGGCGDPVGGGETPPRTLEPCTEPPTRASARVVSPAAADEGNASQTEIENALAEVGADLGSNVLRLAHRRTSMAKVWAAHGRTAQDARDLAAEAKRFGTNPAGLFIGWLKQPAGAADVLLDRVGRVKHAASKDRRREPSALDVALGREGDDLPTHQAWHFVHAELEGVRRRMGGN